ncbi:cyclohexanone monooxygenase [Xylariaceae sp. FL0016]|nr:cyclohexanone monooxygenase [Xylariaceae sp. FL0016]
MATIGDAPVARAVGSDSGSQIPTNAKATAAPGSANGVHNGQGFELLPQWHSQPRKIRIIHVGAGATGLCAAFKMERQLEDYELVCYEKNDEIGGTWLENRYPGCACDVPAHIYTYTFEPKWDWKSYYAYSPEIHQYFMDFCEKYDLRKYIKLQHKVVSAVWHEDRGQWEVTVEHGGQTFTDWCDVLVNASGLLNKWRWPSIPGLDTFNGKLVHSACWDQSVNYQDKRVAVLGTGSSAIQILPQVQKSASLVKSFMRGTTWISPPMPRAPVEVPDRGDEGEEPDPDVAQRWYRPQEMERFRDDPEYLLKYRKTIEYGINRGFEIFYKNSEASKGAEAYMRSEMKRRLKDDPVLTERMTPSWPVGCRRLTPGDGYLEALTQPNVECIFQDITSIDEKGLRTEDGSYHEVDIVVCATGFDMAWTPHFKLLGRGGRDIKEAWSPLPQCYLGLAAPGFPNYFVMNGPRGNLGNGTVLPCLETELEFVIAAVRKMQSDRIKILDVRAEVTDQLNEYIDAWHETSVFSADCKSWYKNNTKDGKVMCWGGSSIHFLKTLKTPRWEHFDIGYMDDNMWAFLGNGRIRAEIQGDFEGMTAYLRNADTPWCIV